MEKLDISQNFLYIKKIGDVIKSEIIRGAKPIKVNGRLCDAFVYVLNGSCNYEFDDKSKFTAYKGDIFYLSSQAVYTMRIQDEKYRFIFCDFEFEDTSPKKNAVFSIDAVLNPENKFRNLLKAHKNNNFAESMAHLYSIYDLISTSRNKPYLENSVKNKIQNAKDYIDIHYNDKNLSVTFLAEKVEFSEVYFRKLFKSQYNVSPSKYISSRRIQKAIELLKYPFLTVEECALQCGFSTVQYFTKVFTDAIGMTPSAFRKQKGQ